MRTKILYILIAGLIFTGCKKKKTEEEPRHTNGFLSEQVFEKAVVEIAYPAGYKPTDAAVTELKNFLEKHLSKPAGIEILRRELSMPTQSIYTFEQLKQIENEKRSQSTNENSIAAWIFFAPGDYSENQGNAKILGIAYGGSSIVLFEKTIRDLSGSLGQPSTSSVEASVLMHEFGHLMGLVDNGTPMTGEHRDEAHGKHCDNGNCLMYYATETSDLIANLLQTGSPSLDQNCINDLRANGGK